ncbi:MAG: transferase hexapeptide repeat family protein [Rhodospirillales bacterium]
MVKVYSIDGVTPVVHPSAFVHPRAVLIGDVVVGPRAYVAPGASLRGDIGRIRVGAGANIQDSCLMHCFPGAECVVEDWGHIGHGVVMHGAVVRSNALIGMNSVLMDGCVVGESAFVAAMSFVPAGYQVPPRTLAAGVPVRIRRELKNDEIAWKRRGTEEYHRIAERSLATLQEVEALSEIEPGRPSLPVSPHQPLHMLPGRSR